MKQNSSASRLALRHSVQCAVLSAVAACGGANQPQAAGGTNAMSAGTHAQGTAGQPVTGTSGMTGSAAMSGGMAPASHGGAGATAGATSTQPMAGATPAAGTAAAAGGMNAGAAAGSGADNQAPTLPAIDDPDRAGPFAVRRVATAPGLSSHTLYVPAEVAANGKHPLVVWTCGNGGTVDFYDSFLSHLGSHGFMIVADKGSSSDRQAEVASQGDAVAWILAENTKQGGDYFGKLDIDHIAVMGHSLGSLASFATAALNEHIATSIHYSGGLTGNPVGFDEAPLGSMTKPAAFLCGGADSTAGPACEQDFTQAPAKLPVFYGVLGGATHIGPFGGTPHAGEYGRAGVAWLRWQLAGDESFKSWFVGNDCTLCADPWTAMQRNLD